MKTLKIIFGILVVIIVLIVVLVILQSTEAITIGFIETIRTDGLFTWIQNLWLDNVTPLWNEHIAPILR